MKVPIPLRRLAAAECGATIIEFAVAAPIVIMLTLGALQLGLMAQSYAGLREVAGWAGREAVVAYQDTSDGVLSESQLETNIKERAASARYHLTPTAFDADVDIAYDPALIVHRVHVKLTYDMKLTIPFIKAATYTLHADRTFYIP